MAKRLSELSKPELVQRLDDLEASFDPSQDVDILRATLREELQSKRGSYSPQDEAEAHAMGFESDAQVASEALESNATQYDDEAVDTLSNKVTSTAQAAIIEKQNKQNSQELPVIDEYETLDAAEELGLPRVSKMEAEEFDLEEGEELRLPDPEHRAKPTALPNKVFVCTKAEMMDIQRKGKLIGWKPTDKSEKTGEVRVNANYKRVK